LTIQGPSVTRAWARWSESNIKMVREQVGITSHSMDWSVERLGKYEL